MHTDNAQFQEELIQAALALGALDAKIFHMEDIAFDSRVLLKCLFGCSGGLHYCPTAGDAFLSLAYPDIIKKYAWGILLYTDDTKEGQEITLALEAKAFLAGYYFAFGATECAVCDPCASIEGKPCADKHRQRPPLYALGIDVYKTVRGLGWEMEVVQKQGDPVKNITAIFVE